MYRRVLTKSTSLKQAKAPSSRGKRRAKNSGITSKMSIISEIKPIKKGMIIGFSYTTSSLLT
jgi:hypothetical protein